MHNSRNGHNGHKMAMPTRWETVMFDPLAYIHRERLHLRGRFDMPTQRAAANRLLLDGYGLTSGTVPAIPQHTGTEKLLLKQWFHLSQIVFLLGCQSLQLELSRRGAILRMSASVRAFLTQPCLQRPGCAATAANDPQTTAHCGRGALLREGLRRLRTILGELPEALAQRIPLLLPPEFDSVAEAEKPAVVPIHHACDSSHALTLTMAIQHVKRYGWRGGAGGGCDIARAGGFRSSN
jgi:type III secretion system OrgA/MxiK family protein